MNSVCGPRQVLYAPNGAIEFRQNFLRISKAAALGPALHRRPEALRHLQGRKPSALQPHMPPEVQHAVPPRLHLLVQLDAWQVPPLPDDPDALPELAPEPEEPPEDAEV
jgi:hypothetical protein